MHILTFISNSGGKEDNLEIRVFTLGKILHFKANLWLLNNKSDNILFFPSFMHSNFLYIFGQSAWTVNCRTEQKHIDCSTASNTLLYAQASHSRLSQIITGGRNMAFSFVSKQMREGVKLWARHLQSSVQKVSQLIKSLIPHRLSLWTVHQI